MTEMTSRTLVLEVDGAVQWPERLLQGSDIEYNTRVLQLGIERSDDTIRRQLESERERFAQELENIQQHSEGERERFAQQLENIQKQAESERERFAQQLENLSHIHELKTQAAQEAIVTLQRQVEDVRTHNEQELARLLDIHLKEKDAKIAQLEDKLKILEGQSMMDMGKLGESVVHDIVQRECPSWNIQDTSTKRHSGDFMIIHPTDKVRIMIEVKNSRSHRNEWAWKFDKDLSTTDVDGGLYISLGDTTFQGNRIILTLNPIPVIMIHNVARHKDLIPAAIECLYQTILQKRKALQETSDVEQKFERIKSKAQLILNGPLTQDIQFFRKSATEMLNRASRMEVTVLHELKVALELESEHVDKKKPKLVRKRKSHAPGANVL